VSRLRSRRRLSEGPPTAVDPGEASAPGACREPGLGVPRIQITPGEDRKTYRAQVIPAEYTLSTANRLLQVILQPEGPRCEVEVKSLAPDAYGSGRDGYQVATFVCRGSCGSLPGTMEQRAYPIPREEHDASSVSPGELRISIDSHFQDFTPLTANAGDAPKLEYVGND
jgi:hypothetical protein